jgi:hypothetical protein
MILKLILFAVAAGFVYRLLGGKIPFIDKVEPKKRADHEFEEIETTSECSICGTYMTEDDALIYQRKAYCSSECLDKAKQIK